MRRLVTLLVVSLVAVVSLPETASAQFDLSSLGKMIGITKPKPAKSPYFTLAENAPVLKSIVGTWKYDHVYIEYLGTNSFADAAISQVDAYFKSELKSADVKPGCFTLTLRSNGKGSIAYEEYLFEGTYTYDASKARFELHATADDKSITCRGYLKVVSGKLVVMVDAQDAVDGALLLFPELKDDSTMNMVQGVVESFPGIYISMRYAR